VRVLVRAKEREKQPDRDRVCVSWMGVPVTECVCAQVSVLCVRKREKMERKRKGFNV